MKHSYPGHLTLVLSPGEVSLAGLLPLVDRLGDGVAESVDVLVPGVEVHYVQLPGGVVEVARRHDEDLELRLLVEENLLNTVREVFLSEY